MYSYMDSMIEDVKIAMMDNYTDEDRADIETFTETLIDDLWVDDSVTGNGSGSYTFSRYQAHCNINDDPEAMNYINEAASEFGITADTIAEKFLEEDWEYFDVTIRCYLLSQAITAAVDELLVP